jgi:hypothetical protein
MAGEIATDLPGRPSSPMTAAGVAVVLRPLVVGLASALTTGLLDWLVAELRGALTAVVGAEGDIELPIRP